MRPALPVVVALATLVGCGSPPPSTPAVVEVPVQPAPPPPASAPRAPAPEEPSLPVASSEAPAPFAMPAAKQNKTPRPADATRNLTKKWSARVGKTTFRTTMAFVDGNVVLGTHGDTLNGKDEASDAVYVLEGATGKIVRRIQTPGRGDKDVGGVAVDGEWVIFTTDNGQVVKAKLADGSIAWTSRLTGKVRPAPALADIDRKGAKDVVVGDESGALHALSGDDGRKIWSVSTGKNDYDAEGFIAAAAIGDLDGDGRDDVVAGARDGALVAYDGRDGKELWRAQDSSGIHASPSLVDVDGDGRLEVLASWSYGTVALFDAKTGALRWKQVLELDDGGIEGLFGSPVPVPIVGRPGVIVQATAWWGGKRGQKKYSVDGIVVASQLRRELRSDEGRVSATPVVMDLENRGLWDAVLGTEAGELLAIDPAGKRTLLAKLGGPIEAPALVADVDRDGTYEILVASNDGLLTCFSTSSKTKPLVSRFRGEAPDNRGNLGAIPLHWKPARKAESRD